MALRLEIHHVDVSGGDCTIILIVEVTKGENDKITEKLLKSVMIDAGGVGAGPKKIVKYLNDPILQRFSDAKEMDYFIASHYHDDHIMGLAYIIKSVKFKQYIDIGSDSINEKYSNVPAYEKGKTPAYYKNYLEIIRKAIKGKYTIDDDNEEDGVKATREHIPFISEKNNKTGVFDIYLDGGKEIILRCVAANGVLSNGANVVLKQKGKSKRTVDPNDKSLAFFLTWTKKNFRYFTAGDLSGDPSLKHYYDIEGELLNYLTKDNNLKNELLPITAMKINHHGSQRSSRKEIKGNFLETLNPRVLLLSANQKKKVPNVNFLTDHLFPFLDKKSKNETMYLGVINNMAYRKSSLVGKGFEKVISIDKKQLNTNIIIENITVKKKAVEIFGNQRPGALIIGVGKPFDSNNLNAPKTIDGSFLNIKDFQLGMMPPITLTKEELEADAVVSRQYTSFELVIDTKYEDVIEEGLLNFFKEVIVMLNKDYDNESGDVLEMVASDFPYLNDNIKNIKIPCDEEDIPTEAEKVATSAMILYRKLFKEIENYDGRICRPEDCDENELETLYNLLYGNPWQIELNKRVFYLDKKNDLQRYYYDWPYIDKQELMKYVREEVMSKKRKRIEEDEIEELLLIELFFIKTDKKNKI